MKEKPSTVQYYIRHLKNVQITSL